MPRKYSLILFTTIIFALAVHVVWHKAPEKAVANHECLQEPAKMIFVKGDDFTMGAGGRYPEEAPAHQAWVGDFWIRQTEVTNAEFAEFVETTGYITRAERPLSPEDFPDIDPDRIKPSSASFAPPSDASAGSNALNGWRFVEGASWHQPEGPGSHIDGREDYPITQLCILPWRTPRPLPHGRGTVCPRKLNSNTPHEAA